MEFAWLLMFIVCAVIIVYTYLGYGALLLLFTSRRRRNLASPKPVELPAITHIIAAYNEEACIREKIDNCRQLDYPSEKIHTIIITDGSNDQTPAIVKQYPDITLMHSSKRQGKFSAMERAIAKVETSITLFSDANAMLNAEAIQKIARHFSNKKVGAVAGEKQVTYTHNQNASKGEGLYWKYESFLKKMDAELHTVVGAAGELFAIRTSLFEKPEKSVIIEDFVLTVGIAAKGYRVAYEPKAIASEKGSANIMEELKRKVRISAGGLQASWQLKHLLNPFKYGKLAFQLFSHRVIRWTLAPISLVLLFVTSALLSKSGSLFFQFMTFGQLFFYLYALVAYHVEQSGRSIKYGLSIFYFAFMNLSVFLGLMFLIRRREMVLWEKAKRA